MSCQPTFELRFSNDLHIHEAEKKKCVDLMTNFVLDYDTTTGSKCQHVTVFPVSRLGFSGAKVFYVNIKKFGSTDLDTKVAKFDIYEDIEKEAKKAEILKQEIFGPYKGESYINELGLLIYKQVPYGKEFLSIMIEENDIAYCCTVLDNLYKELTQSMYKKTMQICSLKNIIEDYNRYLSRKNNPLQKAEVMADYFNDDGRKLFAFYNDLLKSPKNICPVTIHGDLHARNILANGHGSYLIDFDWVDNGHVAKDFTLLECTILYMILPDLVIKKSGEHIRLNELESLHKQLYANFLLKTYSKIVENSEKDKCYAKVFEVIKTIRRYAEQVMNVLYNQHDFKSSFEEYKYSLILISLSQISFQDVNLEILVHTANSIIDSLDETL